jgi:hypothetical protein
LTGCRAAKGLSLEKAHTSVAAPPAAGVLDGFAVAPIWAQLLVLIFLSNGMIYVGTIDQERNAHFDSERFEGVRQVIVLARGEV